MIKNIAIVSLYESYEPQTYRIELHGDVNPFIIAQHIFKSDMFRSGSLKFKELYEALKAIINEDNKSICVECAWESFIVATYTEKTDHSAHDERLEIWTDSFYPFTYFSVNGNRFMSEDNLHYEKHHKMMAIEYILKEMQIKEPKKYNIDSPDSAIARHELWELIDKHDHFKYHNNYEVIAHTITRIDQLEALGLL